MNENILIKQAIVALNFPSIMGEFLVYSKTIGLCMEGNSYFTSLVAKVAKLIADNAILDEVETAFNTVPPRVTVKVRNAALRVVKKDLRSLGLEVQLIANEDPENAEIIITSAGFSVKRRTGHTRKQNTVINGSVEGSVNLIGVGPGPHEWRMSTNGIDWTFGSASGNSTSTVYNLVSGTVYFFQNQQILTYNRRSPWSQSVKIRVN